MQPHPQWTNLVFWLGVFPFTLPAAGNSLSIATMAGSWLSRSQFKCYLLSWTSQLRGPPWSPFFLDLTLFILFYYIVVQHILVAYFIHSSWFLSIPYICLTPPSSLSPLVITSLFSISVSLLLFFVIFTSLLCFLGIPCVSDIIYYLSFSVWLFPQSILSKCIYVTANDKISFSFYGWVVFHCIHPLPCVSWDPLPNKQLELETSQDLFLGENKLKSVCFPLTKRHCTMHFICCMICFFHISNHTDT